MGSPIISCVLALCLVGSVVAQSRPEANAPPVIAELTGPTIATARGAEVTYQVVATDRDDDPLTFEWTLSNGDFFVTTEPTLTYTWPAGGDYSVTVLVDDLEPFHRVTSDPTSTTVTDPLTDFSEFAVQDNEDLDVPFYFNGYVLDRFFLGTREGETDGQLYRSWDGITWIGPLLQAEQLQTKEILWDGTRFILVAMEWHTELAAMVGSVYTSSGGNLWKRVWRSDAVDVFHSAVWDGTQLVIGMQDGKLLVSGDLLKFSEVILPDTPTKGAPGVCREMVLLENHVCVLTGNAIYKLDEGVWSLSNEFAEPRTAMIVVNHETVILGGVGAQVWSTSDGSAWPTEAFYGSGAAPVSAAGQVTEFLEIEGVLWARYDLDAEGASDQWYVKHALTNRWTHVNAVDLPSLGIHSYGAGRLISAQGPDGMIQISESFYPDNTAPTGELAGPSEVSARNAIRFNVSIHDPQEDTLSYWWDQGPGLPWVRGAVADLAWSTGGSKTLTHFVTDMRGGQAMLEHTVVVVDPLDSWTEAETPSQEHLGAIVAGAGGRLVAVGNRSIVMLSDNADAWTATSVGEVDVNLRAVAYSGSHFLAVGGKDRFGRIYRSSNGETWENVWTGAVESTEIRDVIVVGESILGVGDDGLILRSLDNGSSWAEVGQNVTAELLRKIAYGAGRFVVSHWTGTIVSTDGINWTDGQAPNSGWNHLHWVQDRFINTGWRLSEGFWSSSDGQSWERPSVVPQESYEMPIVVGVGSLYYAVGDYSQGPNQVAISVDGVKWFAREAPRSWSRRTAGVIYKDTIITVGNNGQIWRSDGLNPTQTKVVTFNEWRADNPLDGNNGPYDDPDGDGLSNLVEFGLWMKADDREFLSEDGVTFNRGVHVFYNQETGKIDLEHMKPHLVERLIYQLRYTYDFSTWHTAELEAEEAVLGNGGVRVWYRDLERLPGVAAGRCFFEVLVTDLGDTLGF